MTQQQHSEQNRTSAADREAVARKLAAATSEGRIGSDEMEKRVAQAHDAHTYGELEQLLADLPGTQELDERTVPEHTVPETLHLTASLRDAKREGQWKVPRKIVASAGMGTVKLDFTDAKVAHDEVTVDARPNVGKVDLIVPEGYAVSTEESVPGSEPVRDETTAEARSDFPRLHVIANPGMGSIIVRHARSKRGFLPHT